MDEQTQVKLNLRDIQLVAFEILMTFDAYCKKHGLTYYLCGGTLLGAVRHKGFIPWDDDVDLFMARPDFERLIELEKTDPIGGGMELACSKNGKLIRPFARIYDTKTTMRRGSLKANAGTHCWIDLLPVDGITSDRRKWKGIFKKRYFLHGALGGTDWIIGKYSRKLDYIKRLFFFVMGTAFRGRDKGRIYWCKRMERFATRYDYNTSEYVACVAMGLYGEGEVMPRDLFANSAEVEFEGRTFKTMKGWHEYLTGIFKNYMELPPVEKRHPYHMNSATLGLEDYRAFLERHPEQKGTHPEVGL